MDLNCPPVEVIKVLLYLKKYINVKDPIHQDMNILESQLKECIHVRVPVDLLRQSLPVWPGAESSERRKECAALACVWSGLVPFARKLQAHQAWKEIDFLCQSAMYAS